jgi:hypothetical protein
MNSLQQLLVSASHVRRCLLSTVIDNRCSISFDLRGLPRVVLCVLSDFAVLAHDGVLSRRGVDDVRSSCGLRRIHRVLQIVLAPFGQIPRSFLGKDFGSAFVLVHAEARQTCLAFEAATAIRYVHSLGKPTRSHRTIPMLMVVRACVPIPPGCCGYEHPNCFQDDIRSKRKRSQNGVLLQGLAAQYQYDEHLECHERRSACEEASRAQ